MKQSGACKQSKTKYSFTISHHQEEKEAFMRHNSYLGRWTWSPWTSYPSFSPDFIAGDGLIRLGISLWVFEVSCPNCVYFQILEHWGHPHENILWRRSADIPGKQKTNKTKTNPNNNNCYKTKYMYYDGVKDLRISKICYKRCGLALWVSSSSSILEHYVRAHAWGNFPEGVKASFYSNEYFFLLQDFSMQVWLFLPLKTCTTPLSLTLSVRAVRANNECIN